MSKKDNITQLLGEMTGGNRTVVAELYSLLYEELKDIAGNQLYGKQRSQTLSATALVHEAYFRLVDQRNVKWQNRAHFLALAAQAMRRILINYVQSRKALKRGGDCRIATFDEEVMLPEVQDEQLAVLDEALERLSRLSERQSKVVEYRFFGGLAYEEIAAALDVSVPTVKRDWRLARAWLTRELAASSTSGRTA
jgi:RNA polymerase sigma factor (TIGR02999 family)